MNFKKNWLAAAVTVFGVAQVAAQATTSTHTPSAVAEMPSMPSMDHSKMGHDASKPTAAAMAGMDHGAGTPAGNGTLNMPAMPGMDHSKMGQGTSTQQMPPMAGMDHESAPSAAKEAMDMGTMDHGDMRMQGGAAPADARDPHAYSGGNTLEDGPYALAGPRKLKLADEHNFSGVTFNRLERSFSDGGNGTAYDGQAWFGRDYNRVVIKAEGEVANGKLEEARTELLWGHAIATHWDTQLGLRQDSGEGPNRTWLAAGVQGLAPYWFEVDAAAYVGNGGRTALRLGTEYELLLTQKLILQPRAEVNIYGKDDTERDIGRGLSSGVVGLRLRYEFNKQFAPYIGVERSAKFGRTADMARAAGESSGDTSWVAGVRFWF